MSASLLVVAATVLVGNGSGSLVRAAEIEPSARGATAARRIAVFRFKGSDAEAIQSAVLERLNDEPSVEIVPLRKTPGLRGPRGKPERNIKATARRLELAALVSGRVKRAHQRRQLDVTVKGPRGQTVGRAVFTGRTTLALYAAVRADLWRKVGPLIDEIAPQGATAEVSERARSKTRNESAKAPGDATRAGSDAHVAPTTGAKAPALPAEVGADAAATAPTDNRDGAEEDASHVPSGPLRAPRDATTSDERCTFVEAQIGGGSQFRWFNYRNEQQGALRAFTLRGTPVGHFEATVHPFAYSSCLPLSRVGLRGGAESTFGTTARLAGQRLATTLATVYLEVPVSFPVGPGLLKATPGFLLRHTSVDKDEVPDLDYKAVTLALDGELRVGSILLGLGIGGLYALSAGEIESARWFPGTHAFAVTGRAMLGVAVSDRIDLLAQARTELYDLDFRIDAGRTYQNGVASGAYDRYLETFLAVRTRFERPRQ